MCEFEQRFMTECNLLTLICPNINHCIVNSIENYINNKHITLLIIEDMCLGIVMPNHISKKFSYIQNAIKYNEYIEIVKDGMKIIRVGCEWDTKLWSMSKIMKFYRILEYIECLNVDTIRDKIKNHSFGDDIECKIDINFLESLLWNSFLELD